ncbi:hypothetical protein [Micromonospora wenchangensis]|uniref:hypothetical protein n=1 Tax=Micromonospora wenchangensis TaxID=1185415 RepID=UPI0037FB3B33
MFIALLFRQAVRVRREEKLEQEASQARLIFSVLQPATQTEVQSALFNADAVRWSRAGR